MRSLLHSIQSGTLGLIVLALAIPPLISSHDAQAQQAPPQGKQRAVTQETPTSRNSTAIEIKVETFRKQIVPETAVGVIADITNNSSASIYLRQQDVQLVLPADVDILAKGSWEGWFPTEYTDPHEISIKPSETYRVFFSEPNQNIPTAGKSSMISDVRQWFQFINFTPGTYPITVEAKYWDHSKCEGDDYHTAVAAKTGEFVAPLSIILLGAALGGLIFAVLSMVRSEQSSVNGAAAGRLDVVKALTKTIVTLFGSILLSVIITILLSRIAETEFFIKVSVSDFWGAIAVGFLANYGGWALLDKMVPGGGNRGTK
jgi:hypothetical protein